MSKLWLLCCLAICFRSVQSLLGRTCWCDKDKPIAHYVDRNKLVYYMFIDCDLSWGEAEKYCQNKMSIRGRRVKGHLVSIDNPAEQSHISYLVNMHYGKNTHGVWIGGRRNRCFSNDHQGWGWTDGSVFSYTNWNTFVNPSEPNCAYPPDERCLTLVRNKVWADTECGELLKALCEYDPDSDSDSSDFDISISNFKPEALILSP